MLSRNDDSDDPDRNKCRVLVHTAHLRQVVAVSLEHGGKLGDDSPLQVRLLLVVLPVAIVCASVLLGC